MVIPKEFLVYFQMLFSILVKMKWNNEGDQLLWGIVN